MTCGRLYVYDTLLERLAQDLQDVAAELRERIQAEHAMMRQRHVARHRHLAPADRPDIQEAKIRGPKGAGHDDGGAVAGEPGDAGNARGLDGLGEGQFRRDRHEVADFPEA
jgi:hypothetical protein